MKRTLVIDDMRTLEEAQDEIITYARTLGEGLHELLCNGPWDTVLLDHDLGGSSHRGFEDIRPLVRLLAAESDWVLTRFAGTAFYCISSNYHGRLWCKHTLQDAGYHAEELMVPARLHRYHP